MAAFVSKSSVWIRSIYSSFFSHCKQKGLKRKNYHFCHVHGLYRSNGSLMKGHKAEVSLTERSGTVFSSQMFLICIRQMSQSGWLQKQ